MKSKQIFVGGALILAALAAIYFLAIAKVWRHEPQGATVVTTVTVAEVGEFFIYMPLYYANERGFFEKNGLKVKIVASGGDEKSVAAVISGGADFGVGDPTFDAV